MQHLHKRDVPGVAAVHVHVQSFEASSWCFINDKTILNVSYTPTYPTLGILTGYREQLKLQKNKHPEDRTVQNQAQYTGTMSQRSGVCEQPRFDAQFSQLHRWGFQTR